MPAHPTTPSVALDRVTFTWPDGTPALQQLSGAFGAGRTGLIGRNGSGKSTLLSLIAGVHAPASGTLAVAGDVDLLPQRLSLQTDRRVADVLGVGDALDAVRAIADGDVDARHFDTIGEDWDVEARATAALDEAGLPAGALGRRIGELSGGEAVLAGRRPRLRESGRLGGGVGCRARGGTARDRTRPARRDRAGRDGAPRHDRALVDRPDDGRSDAGRHPPRAACVRRRLVRVRAPRRPHARCRAARHRPLSDEPLRAGRPVLGGVPRQRRRPRHPSDADDPRMAALLTAFTAAGMEYRFLDDPPSWFWIDGDQIAIPYEWGEHRPTSVVSVRSGALAGMLSAYFSSLWRTATPATTSSEPWTGLLLLMRRGLTLDAASRQIGVNPRTGRRRIAAAMSHYGVSTLFALGAAWAADGAHTTRAR